MPAYQFYPCPLCSGLAPRSPLIGKEQHTKIMCPRCGTFMIEPTLPVQPWAQLAAEDRALVVFLPAYIRRRNRRNHSPLLTLENWRVLARRGYMVAFYSLRPASRSPAR